MGSHAVREISLSNFPLTSNSRVMQTSQELSSEQSLCVTTQSTLYSGSSLVMALTRRHTGGEEGMDSDQRGRSTISSRLDTITLGTQALRSVANHRKENKANDVAQEATKEGANRTLSDPGMSVASQSKNKLQTKSNQRHLQQTTQERAAPLKRQ